MGREAHARPQPQAQEQQKPPGRAEPWRFLRHHDSSIYEQESERRKERHPTPYWEPLKETFDHLSLGISDRIHARRSPTRPANLDP